ncbi:arylamine N-acetyltransferase [Arthrobacter sp. JSM 101049]|uniref:arylamine N-acetyltransferase family protein n=1 Tax=Arthrobacter sp. JSM 101049 TaxID=929097 RepID=UPI00356347D6
MQDRALTGASWHQSEFDVDAYLTLLGISRAHPGLELLEALHQAHVRTIPFANVDVLLGTHPGVAPAAVQRQLVERGRGGYCFEHAQLFAAALEDLGFGVRRHLGRVHSPHGTRTHMTVVADVEGASFLSDPGFGFSIRGPLPLHDGARRDEGGRVFELRRSVVDGAELWGVYRDGDLQHLTDMLPVQPVDVRTGHFITSTAAGSGRFLRNLVASRFTDDGHVTITEATRTVRVPGHPTLHEQVTAGQAVDLVRDLGIRLVDDEPQRLRQVLEGLRGAHA